MQTQQEENASFMWHFPCFSENSYCWPEETDLKGRFSQILFFVLFLCCYSVLLMVTRDLFLYSPPPSTPLHPPYQVIYNSVHCDANEFYLAVFNWISWLHVMTFHSWEVVLNLIHSKGKSLQFIGCERSQVNCVLMVSAHGLVLSIPEHQAGLKQLLSWQSEYQAP